MVFLYPYDVVRELAAEHGISDIKEAWKSLTSRFRTYNETEEVAARCLLVALAGQVTDTIVLKEKVADEVTARIKDRTALKVGLMTASLTVGQMIWDHLAGENKFNMTQYLMPVTGDFGEDAEISEPVLTVMRSLNGSADLILPRDFNHNRPFDPVEKLGDAIYYHGYAQDITPFSDGTGDHDLMVNCFKAVPDHTPPVEHIIYWLRVPEGRLNSLHERLPMPSTERVTFVVHQPSQRYWDHYPFVQHNQRIPADLCIPEGATMMFPVDGFNLGAWKFPVTQGEGWECGVAYWGGMARSVNKFNCSQMAVYVEIGGFLIWLLGSHDYSVAGFGYRYVREKFQPTHFEALLTQVNKAMERVAEAKARVEIEKDYFIHMLHQVTLFKSKGLGSKLVDGCERKLDKEPGTHVRFWDCVKVLCQQQNGQDVEHRMMIAQAAGILLLTDDSPF